MNKPNRKILFLGETYRADAITWMQGLEELGNFDIITCELNVSSKTFFKRSLRFFEYLFLIYKIRWLVKTEKPNIVIAERSTSYGFLASISGAKIIIIAQQGISDLWPEQSWLYFLKKKLQQYAYKKATLLHAWGKVMVPAMKMANVHDNKIMIMPKGINLNYFKIDNTVSSDKIFAIVTRSLYAEYGHETILSAFAIIKSKNIPFKLTIVGAGALLQHLRTLANELGIEKETSFLGKIENSLLPNYLSKQNIYLSMPSTEGVSASLFEAMATGCYPIVSDILGNQFFVYHRENGQLVEVGNAKSLADEIIWAFENPIYRKSAVQKNRVFVEQHANYHVNMNHISSYYHKLIDQQECAE